MLMSVISSGAKNMVLESMFRSRASTDTGGHVDATVGCKG